MANFDLNNIDITKEMENMTEKERNVLIQFVMKLSEAFSVKGLEDLKDSKSEACKAIYNAYIEMKTMFS